MRWLAGGAALALGLLAADRRARRARPRCSGRRCCGCRPTTSWTSSPTLLAEPTRRGSSELDAPPMSYRPPPPGAPSDYVPPIDHVKLFQPATATSTWSRRRWSAASSGCRTRHVDLAAEETRRSCCDGSIDGTELAWTSAGWRRPGTTRGARRRRGARPDVRRAVLRRRSDAAAVRRAGADLEQLEGSQSAGVTSIAPGPDAGDPHQRPARDRRQGRRPARCARRCRRRARDRSAAGRADRGVALPRCSTSPTSSLRHVPAAVDRDPAAQQRPSGRSGCERTTPPTTSAADHHRGLSWLDALRTVWSERERIWGETADSPPYVVDVATREISRSAAARREDRRLCCRRYRRTAHGQRAGAVRGRPSSTRGRRRVRDPLRLPPAAMRSAATATFVSDPTSSRSRSPRSSTVDAPARPIHIAMPIDTSIAGLRKAPKNVRFMISQRAAPADEPGRPTLRRLINGRAGRRGPDRPRDDLLVLDPDHHDLRADRC